MKYLFSALLMSAAALIGTGKDVAAASITASQCKQLYDLIALTKDKNNAHPLIDSSCTGAKIPTPPLKSKVSRFPPAIHVSPPYDVQLVPQRFFARADNLDNPAPGFLKSPAGQALGLSFGYTANNFSQSGASVTATRSVTATGLIDYIPIDSALAIPTMAGSPSLLFVPSFEVSANGNYDHPTRAFGDTSALKFGPNFTFQQAVPTFNSSGNIYTSVIPFYQTDFYGRASAEGVTLAFLPLIEDLSLGTPGKVQLPYSVSFLAVRPSFTYLNVEQPGMTLLTKREYYWVGGEARAYLFLFPKGENPFSGKIPDELLTFIENRIALIGTYKGFVDARSGQLAQFVSAAAQYKLSCNTSALTTKDAQSGDFCPAGSTSVGVEYDYGFDRDTLQKTDKIMAKLSFAY